MASDDEVSFSSARITAKPHRRRLTFEHRIFLYLLAIGAVPIGVVELLLWFGHYSSQTKWTVTILLVVFWLITATSLKTQTIRPLQTISNMVAALREEDFSFRARGASREDALGELVTEINLLSEALKKQRTGALEAVALLKKVLMEIDVAVFTFDPQRRLRIVNKAGEELLAATSDHLLGHTADELQLSHLLSDTIPRTLSMKFPGKQGRWAIQHTQFREGGVPHELLLVSDLSRALREEERQAWQRLIRVLGHELNNSLAPIKSIAGTLSSISNRPQLPADWHKDVQRGLEIIQTRADALGRFMQSYTKLARLPAPTYQRVRVADLVHRAASVEARLPVNVVDGPELSVSADPDQLEQLLINIIRNAVDASLDPSIAAAKPVEVTWLTDGKSVEVAVRDHGPGLLNSTNLFVPFFTTKAGGSGIGLVLSRQIAEAHGGALSLSNREEGIGCQATVRLPL